MSPIDLHKRCENLVANARRYPGTCRVARNYLCRLREWALRNGNLDIATYADTAAKAIF